MGRLSKFRKVKKTFLDADFQGNNNKPVGKAPNHRREAEHIPFKVRQIMEGKELAKKGKARPDYKPQESNGVKKHRDDDKESNKKPSENTSKKSHTKKKNKRKRQEAEEEDVEVKKDYVPFGEVVMSPPTLPQLKKKKKKNKEEKEGKGEGKEEGEEEENGSQVKPMEDKERGMALLRSRVLQNYAEAKKKRRVAMKEAQSMEDRL